MNRILLIILISVLVLVIILGLVFGLKMGTCEKNLANYFFGGNKAQAKCLMTKIKQSGMPANTLNQLCTLVNQFQNNTLQNNATAFANAGISATNYATIISYIASCKMSG